LIATGKLMLIYFLNIFRRSTVDAGIAWERIYAVE
jgi:hypothetical protein